MGGQWSGREPPGEISDFPECYPDSASRLTHRRIQLMCLYLFLQTSDTTLEEFLEELDALTDAVAEEGKDRDSTANASTSLISPSTSEDATASAGLVLPAPHKEDSSPRTSEKKVRFSEKFLQPAHTKQTAPSRDSADSESACLSSLNASSPQIEALERVLQDQEGCPLAPPVAKQQPSLNECTEPDSSNSSCPPSADRAPSSAPESSVHSAGLSKCNINSTNAGETKLM